jgi:hypothetical protein
MKSLIVVCLLLTTVASPAHADTPRVDLRLPEPQLAPLADRDLHLRDLDQRAHDARVLRNIGIATVTIGTVINLIGVAMVMTNLCLSDSGSCPGQSGTAVSAGFGLIAVGYAGVFAGIPMWAVGGTRLSHAKAEMGVTPAGLVGRF